MKKLLLSVFVALGLVACGSSPREQVEDIIVMTMRSQGIPSGMAKCMAEKIAAQMDEKELELMATPFPNLKSEDKKEYNKLQNKLERIMTDEKFLAKIGRECK